MGLFGAKKDSGKVTQRFADGGYVKQYKDGTTERVHFTKTREMHDFDGSHGKASTWTKRRERNVKRLALR